MAQKTEGIQQLLIAEKKASEKVFEARKRKAQKLKSAKKEAEAEINKFKAEKEIQYKKYEQELLGSKSDNEAKIQVQTDQKVKDLHVMYKNSRNRATTAIMDALFNIEPRLHSNVKM